MGNSESAGLAALRARFAAARGNAAALEALNAQLRGLTGEAFVDLQCEVMAAIQALRSGREDAVAAPAEGAPPPDLVGLIKDRGMTSGQPLYRYGVTDVEYTALRERLGYLHARGGLETANDRSAASFVMYIAEWFRRDYDGGGYSWQSPAPELIGPLSDAAIKALARQGLAWWGRKPRRSALGELRLMSLALEGGFPTRLLESREYGRIPTHLVRLLARVEAVGAVDEELATEMSRTLGAGLGTYDHEEFHALCAELVLAISGLKAEASAKAPAGVAATAWLDAARPGWRDDLPIRLAGDGARRLLDDLVSARAIQLGGGDARAHRLLIWENQVWQPAMRLGMDGEIDLRRSRFKPVDGRLRLHAAGPLASVFAGELGLVEPPTDEEQGWLCRPRGRTLTATTPFETEARVEVLGAGGSETMLWPGGEALRGEVLLFADDSGTSAGAAPQRLEFIAKGSMRTRRERVYCLAPNGFVASYLDGGEALPPFWRGRDFTLFEVSGPVRVGAPDGDHYRVEVGADGERAEQLVFEGDLARGLASRAGLDIYDGPPMLKVRRGARAQSPPAGEVRWRRVGQSAWRDWPSDPPRLGSIEVVWRDLASQALRDRQRLVIVPLGLQVSVRAAGRGTAVELDAPGGWRLSAAPSDVMESTRTASGLDIRFTGRPIRSLPLLLEGPDVEAMPVTVRARIGEGGFFRADGRQFETGAAVMLDGLRGATAFSDGRERLYLRGPERGESRLEFRDEAPLWALSEEITRLLSGGRELDDRVTIEFGRGGGPRLSVGRYDATLDRVVQGLVAIEQDYSGRGGAPGRRLEWFSLLEPGYTLIAEGEGPASLPESCAGPGVALLRDEGRVTGRPTLAMGGPADPERDWCELQAAALIGAPAERLAAIQAALARLGQHTPAAALNRDYLRELVAKLGGIPPSAIDSLKSLAATPAAMAALLATTTDAGVREAVWALERELPFLWCMVPWSAWRDAFDLQSAVLKDLLVTSGIDLELAPGIAADSLHLAAQDLVNLDGTLRAPLAFAGQVVAQSGPTPPTIRQCAGDRVSRTGHLIDDLDPRAREQAGADPATVSCFRAGDSPVRDALPDFGAYYLPAHWEGLDAACAAALSAAGDGPLTTKQILRVRAARAEEPISFADMFAAALSACARGQTLSC